MKPPKGYRLLRVGSVVREDDIRYSFDFDSISGVGVYEWGKPDSWDIAKTVGKKLTNNAVPWARKIKRRKRA